MPSRNGGVSSLLPFFTSGHAAGASSRIPLPRACLSPRIFLSCILVTFSLSWLLLYSSSRVSLGFPSSSSADHGNADWTRLEQQQLGSGTNNPSNLPAKTLQWRNSTLTSSFSCETVSPHKAGPLRTGFNRATVCTVQNLCVDAERGAWIHLASGSDEPPYINVVSADPASDTYFRPALVNQFTVRTYRFVDETLFVYGSDPTNRRTWTMNNLLPLHSVMSSFGGTKSSWFMRVAGQRNEDYEPKKQLLNRDQDRDLETFLLAPNGREIILDEVHRKLAEHQMRPPSKIYPTCFSKAVIGLQSRCTRPFCENLIGGDTLTESLRTKVLEVLGPAMTHYQQTDPDIIHVRPPATPVNDKVVVDGKVAVDGESTPRSKINVALLGRYGNTSIPNMQSLEDSLLDKGFTVQNIHLDYPSTIGPAQAAQLFQKQNIIVAPQGDGLGYADWMEPGSVVVSILPRFTRLSKIYTDRMMASGKRLLAWDCLEESCVQADRDLAHECIEAVENSNTFNPESISALDFEDFVSMKKDFRPQSATWKAIADCYTKEVSRRINSEELTRLIEGLAKDFTFIEPQPVGTPLAKRGAEGDEDVDDIEEDDEEDLVPTESAFKDNVDGFVEMNNPNLETSDGEGDEEDEDQPEDVNADLSESEDLAQEDVIRIQDTKEDQGQDTETEDGEAVENINIHEYDETPAEDQKKDETAPAVDPKQTPDPLTKHEPPTTPETAPETAKETAPKETDTHVPSPSDDHTPKRKNSDHAQPTLSFDEFCRQGRCCGAALSSQPIGTTGAKGLTPCATSMTTMVFGSAGVWGQADESITVQESQSLVWQVDLGRKPVH
ncbi:hypothetical protein EMPS_04651 [Entomortierella parvispora]|uniref:Uncharacterized protein n=1 Tax=Entomortierella parvispora TaxID=205924 RepID=A0A9P3LVR9_9FUNG|nr:hypothetical protein EMPS_04651 [Entomortierella parvispora]